MLEYSLIWIIKLKKAFIIMIAPGNGWTLPPFNISSRKRKISSFLHIMIFKHIIGVCSVSKFEYFSSKSKSFSSILFPPYAPENTKTKKYKPYQIFCILIRIWHEVLDFVHCYLLSIFEKLHVCVLWSVFGFQMPLSFSIVQWNETFSHIFLIWFIAIILPSLSS